MQHLRHQEPGLSRPTRVAPAFGDDITSETRNLLTSPKPPACHGRNTESYPQLQIVTARSTIHSKTSFVLRANWLSPSTSGDTRCRWSGAIASWHSKQSESRGPPCGTPYFSLPLITLSSRHTGPAFLKWAAAGRCRSFALGYVVSYPMVRCIEVKGCVHRRECECPHSYGGFAQPRQRRVLPRQEPAPRPADAGA